jgi:hypothetical protein
MTDTTKKRIGRISLIAGFLLVIIQFIVRRLYEPTPKWIEFPADYLIILLLVIGIIFSIWVSLSVRAKGDK